MSFELRQHFYVEAARFLPYLPKEHPCSRMHGHSFKITLSFSGDLDPKIGWVVDYHEVTRLVRPILDKIDHKILNEVDGLQNPTSELLAKWLFDQIKTILPRLTSINVSETRDTECIYQG